MTRLTRLAVVLVLALGSTGCLVRARPLLYPQAKAHVHHHGCGHHVRAVVVVR